MLTIIIQRLLLGLFVFAAMGSETFQALPDEYDIEPGDLIYGPVSQFESGVIEIPAPSDPEACYTFGGATCCVWEYETTNGTRCAEEWCTIHDQELAWIYSGGHCDL